MQYIASAFIISVDVNSNPLVFSIENIFNALSLEFVSTLTNSIFFNVNSINSNKLKLSLYSIFKSL
nr:hypothetical protein [uncultured Brachyspira sp.]